MHKHLLFLAIGCLGLVSLSCNRPECRNTNSVFSKFSPASAEYQQELARHLHANNTETLTYWLDNYVEEAGREYLTISIQGEGLCAKGNLLVTDWQKLSSIKRTKGQGYRGAELQGLRYKVQQTEGRTELVYQDVERIID